MKDVFQEQAKYYASVHPVSCITGGPGTGKTTTITEIINNSNALTITPTHKAKNVILEVCEDAKVMTVATFTGKTFIHDAAVTRVDEKKFSEVDTDVAFGWTQDINMLIMDECSMIGCNEDWIRSLIQYAHGRFNIVFAGDKDQLPPQESPYSIFPELLDTYPTTILEKNYRSSQGIVSLCEFIKENGDIDFNIQYDDVEYVSYNDIPYDLIRESHDHQIIAWTKLKCGYHENESGTIFNFKPSIGLRIYEQLHTDWSPSSPPVKIYDNSDIIYPITHPETLDFEWMNAPFNSLRCSLDGATFNTVSKYEKAFRTKPSGRAAHVHLNMVSNLAFLMKNSTHSNLYDFMNTLEPNYYRMLEDTGYIKITEIDYNGKYSSFVYNREPFVKLIWGRCWTGWNRQSIITSLPQIGTAHTAQGSGWDYVYVDYNDIMKSNEIHRELLYVACSRAKKKLYIIRGNHA